ncbi:MAG: hypothetical protein Q4F00_02990 [bacterium]|nr:hypothetical protein [bacterium]
MKNPSLNIAHMAAVYSWATALSAGLIPCPESQEIMAVASCSPAAVSAPAAVKGSAISDAQEPGKCSAFYGGTSVLSLGMVYEITFLIIICSLVSLIR